MNFYFNMSKQKTSSIKCKYFYLFIYLFIYIYIYIIKKIIIIIQYLINLIINNNIITIIFLYLKTRIKKENFESELYNYFINLIELSSKSK